MPLLGSERTISLRATLEAYQHRRQKKTNREGSFFRTQSNRTIDFLDIAICDIRLEDIAAGLSKICRFTGQSTQFYSVAEHCILGSKVLEEREGHEAARTFFVHDAPETYLGDVSSPLKALLPGYQLIEERFEEVVEDAFKLTIKIHDAVIKKYDYLMYLRERDLLMPFMKEQAPKEIYDTLPSLPCWTPEEAREAYLERAAALGIECPNKA